MAYVKSNQFKAMSPKLSWLLVDRDTRLPWQAIAVHKTTCCALTFVVFALARKGNGRPQGLEPGLHLLLQKVMDAG